MTEEEKKAIDDLKLQIEEDREELPYSEETLKYKQTLLNLIEKQRKEIEGLKKITNSYNSYGGNLMNDTRIIVCDSRYFLDGTFVNKFVSKDKIRKKIKELEKEICVVIPDTHKIEKINEFKNEGALNILKELLEEE